MDPEKPHVTIEAEQYQPSSLAQDIYQGLGGVYAAAKGIMLRTQNQAFADYILNLKRDKWTGLMALGIDPACLDKQIRESEGIAEDDSVDSSVKISGDSTTHIHVAPGANIPGIAEPPKPGDGNQPPQRPQSPFWQRALPWMLALSMGAGGLGYILGGGPGIPHGDPNIARDAVPLGVEYE